MELNDVYGKNVAGKGSIYTAGITNSITAVKERDPKSIELERTVDNKMVKALESVLPKEVKQPSPSNTIRNVSVEEAIKELLASGEKIF